MARVRSKHGNLLNYFIHDRRDLSPAYVRSCEKFLKEISTKPQAPSSKRQAASIRVTPTGISLISCKDPKRHKKDTIK